MEEILASIRKIISEDSSEPQPAPVAEAQLAPVSVPVESDVLELTREIVDTPAPPVEPLRAAPQPEPVRAVQPEPVRPVPMPENDVVFQTVEEPVVTNEPTGAVHEGIFSDKTRRALDDAFAGLDNEPDELVAPPRPAAAIGAVDGATVEAVFERAVREAFEPVVNKWLGTNADAIVERMKPLIREWMDEHFPSLLEGAVRDEVARVAKARGGRH
ncbi:MAG: DUF2497 domain-containing protein [Alphaproteobacteria bacterium]|nr:DUF2497 domain-containing protein [Alphaproteobacteria bacterium]